MARDEVLDAIREAHLAGMRPSVVQKKLAAGTLGDLSRPVEMSPRSFFRKWSTARREQAHQGPPQSRSQQSETALEELAARLRKWDEKPRRLVEEGLAEAKPPALILEEVVDSTSLTPAAANDLLPPELRLDPDTRDFKRLGELPHMRPWLDRVHRGRPMVAAGASIEEIAEAIGENVHNTGILFGTALAERESAAAPTPRMENR